jgi:hypothetical protein
MVAVSRMRALALSLPEAEEKSHFGHPDFRVRNKIFATLWPSEKRAVLKLDPDAQATALAADPQTFSAPGGWGSRGWTAVDLTRVELSQLRELVTHSWRLTAPRRLVQAFDGDSPAVKAKPRRKRASGRGR